MRKGWDVGGRFREDPINSHEPRGKNREERRHRNDPGLTPTETHIKQNLMRQFMKNPEGGGTGNSGAYRASSAWCAGCGGKRLASMEGLCDGCWDAAAHKRLSDTFFSKLAARWWGE